MFLRYQHNIGSYKNKALNKLTIFILNDLNVSLSVLGIIQYTILRNDY